MTSKVKNTTNPAPAAPTAASKAAATAKAKKGAAAKKKHDPKDVGQNRSRREVTKELMEKEHVPDEKRSQCLQTAIYTIAKEHPFYGSVLQCLSMMYTHELPTAGVAFNSETKKWELFINPYFFCVKLSRLEREAVLLHELLHVTHKHPLRVPFMKIENHKRRIMNIAADLAINQYIPNIPTGCSDCPPVESGGGPCPNEKCPGRCILLEDFFDVDEKTQKRIPWPEGKTMEDYYERLLKRFDEPKDGDDGSGNGKGQGQGGEGYPDTLDTHEWDASAEEGDMLDATEDLVKRAMNKQSLSASDLPGHVKDLLEHIDTRRAELDYKGMILSAIKRSLPANHRVRSWTRKSRRYGTKAPGTTYGELPKLNFYGDTSGSISVTELNEFLDIIDNFLKVGERKCRLNLFHTRNYYSEEYKLGTRLDGKDVQSGGTQLEDSLRDIAKRKPDLAIFLTDGCYGDVNVEKWLGRGEKFPQCLFIISKTGYVDHPLKRLGQTIQIPK